MNCGDDDERSDFFAFNDYSWCDPSSFTQSGWDQKVKNFTGYGLPLFLSEFGCNTNKREFNEVRSLFSTDMSSVYSGGLVYEYSEEGSNYGLVKIKGDSVTEKEDYKALKKALADAKDPEGDGDYDAKGGSSECPKYAPPDWDVKDDKLPTIPEPALKFMTEGAGKGPGFEGKGSQGAGTGSSGTSSSGSSSSDSSSSSGDEPDAAAGLRVPAVLSALAVVLASFFVVA